MPAISCSSIVLLMGPVLLHIGGMPVPEALQQHLVAKHARLLQGLYTREGLYKFRDETPKSARRPTPYRLVGLGYGINQHSTQPLFERETVRRYSEGCLVGWNWQKHLEFVRLYRSDARYVLDRLFRFSATVIPADDLQKHFPFGDVY